MRKIGKLFSLLLCAVMAVGLFPPAALAAQESETAVTLVEDTWDGTSDTSWYNDNGTEFTLNTAEELAGLATLVNEGNTFENKTVYLGGNINLSGYEWISIGIKNQGWRGTFDGQNYQISNLKTRKTGSNFGHGLFQYITSGKVENLYIVDADIESSSTALYMGILADWTNGSVMIRNCHTSGTIHNKTGNKLLGGVIGSAKAGAQIIGCSSDAEIISDYYNDGDEYSDCDTVGGIVGQWENATADALISDCWFGGSISCGFKDSGVGGILGANFDFYDNQPGVDIQNCLVTTKEIRCEEPGNITWIGAVVNGKVKNCLWPDSPPSDVTLDPETYPDYNGNYFAVVKLVVDWNAGTAGPDPTFDQTACGKAVETFNTEEVLTALQTNAGENIQWVSGKEHPIFQRQAAIGYINEAISKIMQMDEWAVKEEDANTEELIKSILETKFRDMQLDMSYTVNMDSVTPAANGIDGSFDFTVELGKNGVSRFVKVTSCIIDATPMPQNAPSSMPELASRSTSSVTLKAVTDVNENGAAVEYGISIDGLTWTWQDSPKFVSLDAGTKYTFALRYKAIDKEGISYSASSSGPVAEISTERATTSSSSDPTYSITISETTGGTVTSNRRYAERGNTVTLTVSPEDGYTLSSLIVTDSKGNELTLNKKGNGKYAFTMPGRKVTVEAAFAKENPNTGAWENPFADVVEGAWYYDSIRYAYENGLIAGYPNGLFGINDTITRGQIATILWRMEESPVVNYAMTFEDVGAGMYYAEAIRWAASEGIVGGYTATQFGPDDAITREQLAAILWRYAQYKEYDVSVGEDTNILSYADALTVSEWAVPAMQWANGAGLIQGSDNNLMPRGNATRAQAAAILHRFCETVTGE